MVISKSLSSVRGMKMVESTCTVMKRFNSALNPIKQKDICAEYKLE